MMNLLVDRQRSTIVVRKKKVKYKRLRIEVYMSRILHREIDQNVFLN